MSSNSVIVRRAAVGAPILMLTYGLLRLVDGFDGHRGPGLAWNIGHLAFFAAMVLFGFLAVRLTRLVPRGARRVASVAAVATVFGAACFLWVITGDLSRSFRESAPLPEFLEAAGPMAFTLGMLTLLGLSVAARRVPFWSPLLFGLGIAAITVRLDLLPLGALLLMAAFAPLGRRTPDAREQVITPMRTTARALH
ncbi:hypothetical protein [Actinoplanes sp. GCM10030250]|uniref:hypothetical protein n=1 Tax=Actinoplanes sp. GCM10030250 TaxID=3273376 RepID=UPI003607317A